MHDDDHLYVFFVHKSRLAGSVFAGRVMCDVRSSWCFLLVGLCCDLSGNHRIGVSA
jgi:hypothetical protein